MESKDAFMPDLFLKKMLESFPDLPSERTLLAVSAGIDSLVMAHLFAVAGWPFGIAHCNFQLRGADSDGDEALVRNLAEQLRVPFHAITFDTVQEAERQGVSIQMVARTLRYDWLEAIRKTQRYTYVATAHHLNDSIETCLINQTRGTGIRGLLGIPIRQGPLIRPMLVFTRAELAAYQQENKIVYREDSSNLKDDYYRNRIRHHVIPVLQGINPALENTFRKNLSIWSEAAYLMEWACQQLRPLYVKEKPDQIRIDFTFIADHPAAALSLFYEWVKDYGFHGDQLQQAIVSAGRSTGAVWYSPTHRLLVDRDAYWLDLIKDNDGSEPHFTLEKPGQLLLLPDGKLSADLQAGKPDLKRVASDWVAYLDADNIAFPLSVRHWEPGDFFSPLGMGGQHKKVQDFFTDEKISRFEKEKIWLVHSATGDILWIIGHRIDEKYKIRDGTERTLALEFRVDK